MSDTDILFYVEPRDYPEVYSIYKPNKLFEGDHRWAQWNVQYAYFDTSPP